MACHTIILMILLIACFVLQCSAFALRNINYPQLNVKTIKSSSSLQMGFFNFNPKGASTRSKIDSNKKICVITGTTSGLGLSTARELINSNKYYVICACRDVENMKRIAEINNFDEDNFSVLNLDLGSFKSVRQFVSDLKTFKGSRPLDRLVCNAAVYQPALSVPRYSSDDIEQQLQINHLSHFLLCSLLINDMKNSKDARMIVVGSITGNDNTVGGGVVLPLADLGNLQGLANGAKKPIAMVDGQPFNGAKAYKDSKICNMMTITELHRRYHKSTGITFSTMYPGCIATTQLFREKRSWFRTLFPLFMKYVTGGFVSEEESGQRLAQVVDDEICKKSGVYWGWNGGAKTVAYIDLAAGGLRGAGGAGGSIFENDFSAKVINLEDSKKVWDYSTKIVNAQWPAPGPESELPQIAALKAIKDKSNKVFA